MHSFLINFDALYLGHGKVKNRLVKESMIHSITESSHINKMSFNRQDIRPQKSYLHMQTEHNTPIQKTNVKCSNSVHHEASNMSYEMLREHNTILVGEY
jgi:hypothetical protein